MAVTCVLLEVDCPSALLGADLAPLLAVLAARSAAEGAAEGAAEAPVHAAAEALLHACELLPRCVVADPLFTAGSSFLENLLQTISQHHTKEIQH